MYDLSHEEIAAQLGLTLEDVEQHLVIGADACVRYLVGVSTFTGDDDRCLPSEIL